MNDVRADARYSRAILATSELMGKLRLEHRFVGTVARSAWMGDEVTSGPVDVIALMGVQQKNQVAMMASHRGFRVEQGEIDQTVELDLIPLNYVDPEGDVRIHVLVASNALYARMVAAGGESHLGDLPVRVAAAEDLALLVMLSGEETTVHRLSHLAGFDRQRFNDRLQAIGLGGMVINE